MKSIIVRINGQDAELPPGYMFDPTDEELVIHYLQNKIISGVIPADVIEDIQANSFYNEIPVRYLDNGQKEWYFFIHGVDDFSARKKDEEERESWTKMGEETIFLPQGNLFAIKYQWRKNNSHWRLDEYRLHSHIYENNKIVHNDIVLGKLMRGIDYDIE